MSIVEDQLKAIAREVGFDVARIARADAAWEAGGRLTEFVAAGRHGDMGWMEETLTRRSHPTAMWPAAKSALVVGLNYGPAHDPLEPLTRPEHATISVYAQNVDYHDLMKRRLKQLASAFATKTGHDVKVFVDTAPLMEKPLAHRSGIGWQGKHTNLVSRDHGSWLFLGVMLTDADLTPDDPGTDTCGSCSACVDICPTRAFLRRISSMRAAAFHISPSKRKRRSRANSAGRWATASMAATTAWRSVPGTSLPARRGMRPFTPGAELTAPLLADLAELDDASFREVFAGSPIKRIGRDRFIRNVMIAIGNAVQKTDKTRLVELCIQKLDDASPLVRGASVWALGSLSPTAFEAERLSRRDVESDPGVCEEWDAGPAG